MAEHGTLTRYSYGCKCTQCKAAKARHSKKKYHEEAEAIKRYKTLNELYWYAVMHPSQQGEFFLRSGVVLDVQIEDMGLGE